MANQVSSKLFRSKTANAILLTLSFSRLQNSDLYKQITAGSVAAVFQTTMTYPFEYLKTGLQLQPKGTAFEIILPQIKSYFVGCSA